MENNLTVEEIIATLNGESLEELHKKITLRTEISEESVKYLNTPSSQWPPVRFNWDTSVESQRFSLDGATKEIFKKNYPNGFFLGYVSLNQLDSILCQYSRRDEGELWGVGFSSSLAYLIVYLSRGFPISPPLVKPLENGELIFQGGHHRYAIAKEICEITIPIYVEPEFKNEVNKLLTVNWVNT